MNKTQRIIKAVKYIEISMYGFHNEITLEITGLVSGTNRSTESDMHVDDLEIWAVGHTERGKPLNMDFEPLLTAMQIRQCEVVLMEKYNDGE